MNLHKGSLANAATIVACCDYVKAYSLGCCHPSAWHLSDHCLLHGGLTILALSCGRERERSDRPARQLQCRVSRHPRPSLRCRGTLCHGTKDPIPPRALPLCVEKAHLLTLSGVGGEA